MNLFDALLDRLAFIPDWGFKGILQRARLGYVRHRWLLRKTENQDAFDRRFGTDTSRKLRTRRYGLPKAAIGGAVMYWATPASSFEEIVRSLPVPLEDYDFIDLGCGKGRTLLLASNYPFRRITGVELSPRLARIARDNWTLYKGQTGRRQPCEVLCANATEFTYSDRNCVVYFFNPFDAATLQRVLDNLVAARQRYGMKVLLVYLDPTPAHLEVIGGQSAFRYLQSRIPATGSVNGGSFGWSVFVAADLTGEPESIEN